MMLHLLGYAVVATGMAVLVATGLAATLAGIIWQETRNEDDPEFRQASNAALILGAVSAALIGAGGYLLGGC